MKKSFRAASIVCALTLLASVATACGNQPADGNNSTGSTGESKTSSSGSAVTMDNAPTLEWWVVGNGQPENWEDAAAIINPIAVEKAGAKINVNCVKWGEWDQKRNTMVQSAEPYDIMFTNEQTYAKEVQKGYFADITETLKNEATDLYNFNPEALWKGVTINDKIWGVPSYKDSAQAQFWAYDKALVEELNLDIDNVNTLEDLEPILKAIKDSGKDNTEYPLRLAQGEGLPGLIGTKYDGLSVGLPVVGMSLSANDGKVVNVLEQDDIKNTLATLHDYFQKGYINPDAATLESAPTYSPVSTAQGFPGSENIWAVNAGIDAMVIHRYAGPFYTSGTIQGSINCISSGSKYKTEAVKFLQLVNTDETVRNILAYGVEGVDWEYTDDEKDCITRIRDNWGLAAYTQGTFMNLLPSADEDSKKSWADNGQDVGEMYTKYVKEQNEEAKESAALGFIFDNAKVETQVTACNTVWMKYRNELWTGTSDPAEVLPRMIEEMNNSGLNEIIEEAQTQLDAFLGK